MLIDYPDLTVGPIFSRSFGPVIVHKTTNPEFWDCLWSPVLTKDFSLQEMDWQSAAKANGQNRPYETAFKLARPDHGFWSLLTMRPKPD